MTGKRVELLHYVRRHNVTSVRAFAKALGRDYSNVHDLISKPYWVDGFQSEQAQLQTSMRWSAMDASPRQPCKSFCFFFQKAALPCSRSNISTVRR
jgi:hypothetical protein